MKRIVFFLFILIPTFCFSQVGVNTTNPDPSSMLDITSTDKGVLVPRVSLTSVTTTSLDGTNTAATGLLIWNTNSSTTGGNGVGFYFFNGTQWMPITQTASLDHDIYEVGSTNPPNAINDNKYTEGSLSIGTNTVATGVLDIDNSTKVTSVDINNTYAITPTGINLNITTNTSGKTGLKTEFNGTNGSGSNSFVSNTDNLIGNTSRTAIANDFNGTSSSISTTITGMKNDFKSTSSYYAILYGVNNLFSSNANSWNYGVSNTFSSGGSNPSYGLVNTFNGTSTGSGMGVINTSNNYIGNLTGLYNYFSGSGDGVHYGIYNSLSGTGSGDKYGFFNYISSSAGGTHYGLYSIVPKPGSYAGYFLGNVSIGTTSTNNYILPTSRGTNGQTMQTDGSGNVSWVTPTSSTDHDIYEVGGTTAPNAITDNKYTEGTLTIGTNTAATGVLDIDNATKTTSVDINNTFATNPTGIDLNLTSNAAGKTGVKTQFNGMASTGTNSFIQNTDNMVGNTNRTAINNDFSGTSSSISTTITGLKNDFKSTSNYYAILYGVNNSFASTTNAWGYGMLNSFTNGGSTPSFGVVNSFNGTSTGSATGISNSSNNYNGAVTGLENSFSGTGNGIHYGISNSLTGTGSGDKYGTYNYISNTAGGTHYGLYTNVLKTGSYAGYFLGNVSIGTTTSNNYILPSSRGTNGQIMQTDGSGNVSWVNSVVDTDTDDQTTDVFSLTGNTLNLSLQNDGVATQTVDLSSLKDHDWYEVGGTTQPDAITDAIYHTGDVAIGKTTANYALDISESDNAKIYGVALGKTENSGSETAGIYISKNTNGVGIGNNILNNIASLNINSQTYGMQNIFSGTANLINLGVFNDFNVASQYQRGIYNSFSNVTNEQTGLSNLFGNVTNASLSTGVSNNWGSTNTVNANMYGVHNLIASNGNGDRFGIYTSISGTGIGDRYGSYNQIATTAGGQHFGVYSNVLKSGSYAGYFLGNVSIGTTAGNSYILPPSRGTNGQIMQTDGSGNVSWVNPVVDTDTDDQTTDVFSLTGDTLNLSLQNDGVATQTVDLSPLKDHDWYEVGTTSAPNAITDNIFTQGNVAIGKNTISSTTKVDIENTDKTASLTLSNTYDVPSMESAKYGIYNTLNSVELQIGIKNDLIGDNSSKTGISNLFQGSMNSAGATYGMSNVFEATGASNQAGIYNQFISSTSTALSTIGMRNWFASISGYTNALTGVSNEFNNHNNGEHTAISNTFTGPGTGTKYGIKNTYTGTSGAQFYGSYTSATSGSGTIYGAYNNLSVPGNRYGVYNNLTSTGVGQCYGTYNKINNTGGSVNVHYGIYNEMLAFDNQYGNYTTMPNGSGYPQYGNFVTIAGAGTGNRYGFYSTISSSAGGTHYGVYSDATKAGSYAGFFLGNVSIGTTAGNSYILPPSRGTNGQIMQTDGSGNVSWVNQVVDTDTDTDNQQIDVLSLTGDTLNISLQDDAVATQTLNLAAIDNQATDVFSLTGNTLNLSLQNDGVATQTVDLSSLSNDWKLTGNAGTVSGTNFIGTTDAQDLDFRTNNTIKLKLTQQGQLSIQNTGGSVFVGAGSGNVDDLTNNQNTLIGTNSGSLTSTGNLNTAIGHSSLEFNTSGFGNTAIGRGTLANNIIGANNTALGRLADVSADGLSNATAIGFNSVVNSSAKVRIGNTAVTVIEGQVAYTNPSDARFKFNIQENVPGLDFIQKLKPVTYNFDTKKFDEHLNRNRNHETIANEEFTISTAIVRTGFLAQDVEKICADLGYNFDGLHIPDPNNPNDNYGLAYSQFIMPLVKAVQEQQVIIENQKTELQKLQNEINKIRDLEQRINALEAKK